LKGRELVPPGRLDAALGELPGWRLQDGRLCRDFRFEDFVGAFSFMCAVALLAQRMDHHPDWSNSYNTVQVRLSTHDLGGISTWDIRLAAQISGAAAGGEVRPAEGS
jgi:4a-hydroxytetrahydrobiopterin dehydratase